jgi:prepilin-type N-terminal cleavage/methylation domain-containing protein
MLKKAFTLIELLVVIGIMAVLAAGVVALIDPVDKTHAANDAKTANDISQLATALQSSAAQNPTGLYPANLAALQTAGELTTVPVQPVSGAAYVYAGGGTAAVTVTGTLRSKKFTTGGFNNWQWSSTTGKSCPWSGAACMAGY